MDTLTVFLVKRNEDGEIEEFQLDWFVGVKIRVTEGIRTITPIFPFSLKAGEEYRLVLRNADGTMKDLLS